jgi:FAD synthase
VRSYAVTFEPHPQAVLHPENKPSALTVPDHKVRLIQELGIDQVWVYPFTREFSLLSPKDFMDLVQTRQPIAELWVGTDFGLGRNRSGTVSVLAEIAANEGWALHVIPPYRYEGRVISSTGIRAALSAGDVRTAGVLLGRPFTLSGEVVDESAGTLRLRVPAERSSLAPAVYAGQLRQDASVRPAAIAFFPSADRVRPHELRVAAFGEAAAHPGQQPHVAFMDQLRPLDAEPDRTLADGAAPADRSAVPAAIAEFQRLLEDPSA